MRCALCDQSDARHRDPAGGMMIDEPQTPSHPVASPECRPGSKAGELRGHLPGRMGAGEA